MNLKLDNATLNNAALTSGAYIHVPQLIQDEMKQAQARNVANTSGIIPMDLRVLVLPDPVEEVTAGGIIIANTRKERDEAAQTKATLIAIGENAWSEAANNPDFVKPRPGDRILIGKYAGGQAIHTGRDGKEYRIMNDADVIARLEE